MIAFGSEAKISKERLLKSLKGHREADRITQGTYWDDGRGCAVGCSIHDFAPGYENEYQMYEILFGIPGALAELEDKIFEDLPITAAKKWPERFIRAIQPGADLSRICDEWLLWLLSNDRSPLAPWQNETWMRNVARLYERRLNGDEPDFSDWRVCKERGWEICLESPGEHLAAYTAVEAAAAGLNSYMYSLPDSPAATSPRFVCYYSMKLNQEHHKYVIADVLLGLLAAAPVKKVKNEA